jgi:hypothetical protein
MSRRDPLGAGLPRPPRSVLGVSRSLDGFSSLRPCGHARSAAAPGVPTPRALSGEKAVTRRRVRRVLSTPPRRRSHALASARPHASDSPRRLSRRALVPRPWSQSS